MGKTSKIFLSVSEVQGLLGMSKSYCYELVAKLNDELEKMDKIVIPDAEKAKLFQRLLFPHPHPSKTAVIMVGMIGKFRKTACHFAPDAPCPGTS